MVDHDKAMINLIDEAEKVHENLRKKYRARVDRQIILLLATNAESCEHNAQVYKNAGLM